MTPEPSRPFKAATVSGLAAVIGVGLPLKAELAWLVYFARPWYPCVSVWIFHAALRPTR